MMAAIYYRRRCRVSVEDSQGHCTSRYWHPLYSGFRHLGAPSTASHVAISRKSEPPNDGAWLRSHQLLKDRAVWGALGIACTLNFGKFSPCLSPPVANWFLSMVHAR